MQSPLNLISPHLNDRWQNLPQLNWARSYGTSETASSNIGGNTFEFGRNWITSSVSADRQGNAYLTGSEALSASSSREFIYKIDENGATLWQKYLQNARIRDSKTDRNGHLYVTGQFSGTLDLGRDQANNQIQLTAQPGNQIIYPSTLSYVDSSVDAFIAKYAENGTLLWAQAISGSGTDTTTQIAIDQIGNVYLTGIFTGNQVDFGKNQQNQRIQLNATGSDNDIDIFITKLNGEGRTLWARNFGGDSRNDSMSGMGGLREAYTAIYRPDDTAHSIAVDQLGNVYFSGEVVGRQLNFGRRSNGQVYPVPEFLPSSSIFLDPHQDNFDQRTGGIFLAQLNADGATNWVKPLSNNDGSINRTKLVANRDGVYLAAQWAWSPGISIHLPQNPSEAISLPRFADPQPLIRIERFNQQGDLVSHRNIEGGDYFRLNNMALDIDAQGNLYLSTHFSQQLTVLPNNPNENLFKMTSTHAHDTLIASLTSDLNVRWMRSFEAANSNPVSIAVGSNNNLFFAGWLEADSWLGGPTVDAGRNRIVGRDPNGQFINLSNPVGTDAFLLKLSTNQPTLPLPETEILWHNRETGEVEYWVLKETEYLKSSKLPTLADRHWEYVGRGDFNSDGESDLLWYHRTSGFIGVWYMDGVNLLGSTALTYGNGTPIQIFQPADWQISAIGDFNRDGYLDLFWFNQSNGLSSFWHLQNHQLVGMVNNAPQVGDAANWQVTGVGDYNRDGHLDLFWRNQKTGLSVFWQMSFSNFQGLVFGVQGSNTNRPQDQQLFGLRDLTGDGYLDVLEINRDRTYAIVPLSLMARSTNPTLPVIPGPVPTGELKGIRDLNQDGQMEFLWYDRASSTATIWNIGQSNHGIVKTLPKRTGSGWEILDLGE